MATVRKRYALPFPRARVFAAWLSNDSIVAPVTKVDIEPHVGGHYRLSVGDRADAPTMHGRVITIEQDRHVRHTWRWDTGKESLVDVWFDDSMDNTVVLLEHSELADDEDADRHSAGWDSYIEGLQALMSP